MIYLANTIYLLVSVALCTCLVVLLRSVINDKFMCYINVGKMGSQGQWVQQH